jgi:hypothetical protein
VQRDSGAGKCDACCPEHRDTQSRCQGFAVTIQTTRRSGIQGFTGSMIAINAMIGTIELTEEENEIASRIAVAYRELLDRHDFERAVETGRLSSALFKQLLDRKAIPQVRLRYFADPSFHAGNTKSSRRELFLRNAHTEEKMYTHPHFWPYLLYFVYGADLPQTVRDAFQTAAWETFRDWDALRKLARKESRLLPGERTGKAEQFYKLALDCGCDLTEALGVRDAVMKTR